MTDHTIAPPPELVQQWKRTAPHQSNEHEHYHYITLCAAQWGADQELEACCEWLIAWDTCEGEKLASFLREGRRPKPPSLKEQALEAAHIELDPQGRNGSLIIRALEALPDD
jgi:hypothetical protein